MRRILVVKSGSLLAFDVFEACQLTPRSCRIRRIVSMLIVVTRPVSIR
jgi:hypothetical protein